MNRVLSFSILALLPFSTVPPSDSDFGEQKEGGGGVERRRRKV